MKNILVIVASILVLLGCGSDPGYRIELPDADADVSDSAVRDVMDVRDAPIDSDASETADSGQFNFNIVTSGTLSYHGGRILPDAVHVYLIWYGDWTGNTAKQIIGEFVSTLGESAWFDINRAYYQLGNPPVSADAGLVLDGTADGDSDAATLDRTYVTGKVELSGSIDAPFTHGSTLRDEDIRAIVTEALASSSLSEDEDAVYFVLTSADIQESSGYATFCGGFCGYHDHFQGPNKDIKYAFVGNPENCLDTCSVQTTSVALGALDSPNHNWGADAMISVIAHELAEATTDPDINAWSQDLLGYENADKCAWRFEPVYQTSTGAFANVHLGTKDYLVQQNWVMMAADSGRCDLHR